MTNEDPLAPARGVVNGCAIGAILWAAILGAAWLLLGGGAGCGSTPTPVPFGCVNFAYHWGSRQGFPAIPYVQVADCEANGINDTGPTDTDAADPTDPHYFWNYAITPAGEWTATNCAWTHDTTEEAQAWTWTGLGVGFQATAGTTYRATVTHTQDACLSDAHYYFTVHCPGMTDVTHYSWLGEPIPAWTAPEAGLCQFEARNFAVRVGVDPLVPLEECCATDVFKVYR